MIAGKTRTGIHFGGAVLPLIGMSVFKAKAMLRDDRRISFFSEAVVNGRPVVAGRILRAGDRLDFSQRFGFKGGEDRTHEEAEAKALLNTYPDLEKLVAEVAALDRPPNRKLDLLTLRLLKWAERRFGPITVEALGTLTALHRLLATQAAEFAQLAGSKKSGVPIDSQDRIVVNEADGVVSLNGVRYAVEPVYLSILDCLVKAGGGWVSSAELQDGISILQDEERIDRIIAKMKETHPRIGKLIQARPGRGFRVQPT